MAIAEHLAGRALSPEERQILPDQAARLGAALLGHPLLSAAGLEGAEEAGGGAIPPLVTLDPRDLPADAARGPTP